MSHSCHQQERHARGQALAEYALCLGLIVILSIAALTAMGGSINSVVLSVSQALTNLTTQVNTANQQNGG